jgi:MFS family permease
MRALRHRNFQLFFSGQLVSLIGTWMQMVAQSWLVYRLTGSAALLGAMGFAAQFPVALMAPLGGITADRHNRHRIVITTQTAAMIQAAILAALVLSGHIRIWHLFVLASSLGVVNAFDLPARQSLLVDMVGKEDLMNAIALNSSLFNGARILGPAVAGILVAAIGEGWCFFANAASFIAVIVGLLLMRITPHPLAGTEQTPLENLREGFRWVRGTRPVRSVLLLLGLVSLVGMPYAVLMPIFAGKVLHGGARSLGILMGATGVGALLGALTMAARRNLIGLGRWIACAAVGFGISLILFSLSRIFLLSVLLLIPLGFAMMVQMASSNTLIQSMVPDRLRGRVMSVYSMMFLGMAPLGALSAGLVAHRLGAPMTLVLGGLACICGSLLLGRRLANLHVEAREIILAQQPVGGEPSEGD